MQSDLVVGRHMQTEQRSSPHQNLAVEPSNPFVEVQIFYSVCDIVCLMLLLIYIFVKFFFR